MKKIIIVFIVTVIGGFPFATNVNAAAVQWRVSDGGNGHWYEAFNVPEGIRWDEANLAALRAGPRTHLATITSAAENDFVFNLINDPEFWFQSVPFGNAQGPWLGGLQIETGTEPIGGWRWVSAEAFSYTNWGPREPNQAGGIEEDFLHFWGMSGIAPTWNDTAIDGTLQIHGLSGELGYVIETSAVPIPGAIWLFGFGLIGLLGLRKSKHPA